MQKPFAQEELAIEVKEALFVFAYELGRHYSMEGAFRLLGPEPTEDEKQWLFLADSAFERLELAKTGLGQWLPPLYAYAFEARLPKDMQWDCLREDVAPFVYALQTFAAHYDDNINGKCLSTAKLRLVLELVYARAVLNEDEPSMGDFTRPQVNWDEEPSEYTLTLRQLALLAQVDEKTLRNAASANAKNPLRTISVRNRTFVPIDVARQWLKARGQYLPTIYADGEVASEHPLLRFDSLAELAQYVSARLSICDKQLHDLEPEAQPLAQRLVREQPVPDFETQQVVALARSLKLDAAIFANALLAIQQAYRKEALAGELRALHEASRQPSTTD
jgi:hypothetical protein